MEENFNLEQPAEAFTDAVNVGEQNTQELNHESTSNQEAGSTEFGKFKDATTLYEAYNNLQKEFTRKSQQLSAILKNSNFDENSKNIQKNGENYANSTCYTNENAVFDNNKTEIKQEFAYQKNDWTNKAISFLNSKDDAKQYSAEMAKLLINDKALAQSPNCLEYAYAAVKNKAFKEPASYLTDQKFLEDNVFNNDEIKNKIIEDYLSKIVDKRKQVKVITGQAENLSVTRPADKPKNIKEASLILKKLLQP